jgi:hypothetical protein
MGSGKNVRAATAAALALAGTSSAQAAEIISVSLGDLLANGQSASKTFNISSFLTSASGAQLAVAGATLKLEGYSPHGVTGYAYAGYGHTYAYTYYYSYSCGSWWSRRTCYGSGTYYTFVPAYTAVDAVSDGLTVAVGSATATGWSPRDSSYAGNYYGSMVASLNLGAAELLELNTNGLLNYTAGASTNTSITVDRATLTFHLVRLDGAVPEPTTWAMLILGLGAAGGAMRRRIRAQRIALA